jgi:hypothetical protein
MSRSSPPGSLKKILFAVIMVLVVPLLTLGLVEGATSGLLFARDVIRSIRAPNAWRQRVTYDSLLGWKGAPNVRIRGAYGRPGTDFRTNAQGFRHDGEVTRQPAPGRVRILCSGDSFTMGSGMDNEHTWCALLAAKDPRFETVNLGQGGYGFDQAYLRFKRDGRPLEHSVHVFAFITDDFQRMRRKANWFWGKPVLILRNGALTVDNTPVPRLVPRFPELRFVLGAAQQLRTSQFLGKVGGKLKGRGGDWATGDSALAQVVSAAINDLGTMSRADSSLTVLVYLPILDDYLSRSTERWSRRLHAAATRSPGVFFLDLTPELKRLPPDTVAAMFIPRPPGHVEPGEGGGHGHYTIRGNQWVANNVARYLGEVGGNTFRPAPRTAAGTPRR